MNYNDFTKTAQIALKEGSFIAKTEKSKSIENAHILKGILKTDTNVTPFILRTVGVDIDQLKNKLEEILYTIPKLIEGDKLTISKHVEESLNVAKQIAKDLKDDYISIEHILTAILITGDSVGKMLIEKGISKQKIEDAIKEIRKNVPKKETSEQKYPTLSLYAVNLNEKIKNGEIDPVIGRTDEIRNILQIISRRRKNNPIIIGEAGVGKTAVVEGLAQRIVQGDIPENLKNNIIFALDLGAVVAGASKQGQFEERLKNIVKEVKESAGEIILFIDEIHLLVGAGASGGAMDAANILKPALARGELKAIGATTIAEYQRYFEKDKALVRRFRKVVIEEPSIEDTVSILRGIKEKYQGFHKVRIKDDALIAAVELSKRYMPDSFLPDKAIDLIDEAAAKLRIEMNSLPDEIDELERNLSQLKTEKQILISDNNTNQLDDISNKIADLSDQNTKLRAIWESEKKLIKDIIETAKLINDLQVQSESAKKQDNFELVAEIEHKSLTEAQNKLTKLNKQLENNNSDIVLLREFVDKDMIAEMISEITGIPVNKMSKSDTEKLINLEKELENRVIGQTDAVKAVSEAVRRSRAGLQDAGKPIGSFIFLGTTGVGKTELAKALAEFLFDDEKAIVRVDMSEYQEKHTVSRLIGSPPGYVGHDDGGQLTEQVRQKPYSVVLLDEIEKAHSDIFNTFLQVLDDGHLTDSKGRVVNFKNTIVIMTSNAGSDKINENFSKLNKDNYKQIIKKSKEDVSLVLKEKMSPEFLNRIDEIIMFSPLSIGSIRKIVDLQIKSLSKKLVKRNIHIHLSPLVLSWLARISYNPQFGARPVKRSIQRHIINELSDKILRGEIDNSKIISIDLVDSKLSFTNVDKNQLEALKIEQNKLPEIQDDSKVIVSQPDENTIEPEVVSEKGFWKKIGNRIKKIF